MRFMSVVQSHHLFRDFIFRHKIPILIHSDLTSYKYQWKQEVDKFVNNSKSHFRQQNIIQFWHKKKEEVNPKTTQMNLKLTAPNSHEIHIHVDLPYDSKIDKNRSQRKYV